MVFCYVGTKNFTTPIKIRIFGLKNGQIWSKICIFGHFGPNIAIFCHMLSNVWPKTNVNKVPRSGFPYVGDKTFDFFGKKLGFFAQKSPNLARKWHFCSFWARPCWLIWLVVVARGLYLARHLFTLYVWICSDEKKICACHRLWAQR